MNQLNSIIVEGNLVQDCVVSEPCTGFKKALLTLGVNRFYKNRNGENVSEVSFFDVEVYNLTAEYAEKNAKKGRGVRVVGRLKQDSWTNSDGKKCSRIYIIGEHIEFKAQKLEIQQVVSEEKETESEMVF